MIIALILGIWFIGFLIQLRRAILDRADVVERHVAICKKKYGEARFESHEMLGEHTFTGFDGFSTYSWIIAQGTGWPILALAYLAQVLFRLSKFLMFPKGIVTKYAKEKQKEAAALALHQRVVAAAQRINDAHRELGLAPIDFGPVINQKV